MRVALGVEYDGSAFQGWQKQPGGRTVQDALEVALTRIAVHRVATVCAGRTDAGVHARGQVVHFDTDAVRPLMAWVRGINTFLPVAVAVRWANTVSEDFHARFSAYGRCYRYILVNRPQRVGIDHGRVGWYHHPLDEKRMQQAADRLLGEHDFSVFRAAECQAKSPVKVIRHAQVRRLGDSVVFDFEAGAFLHHMVRNMVGSLVYVGQGRHSPEWISQLLESKDRKRAAPTFSASGLYLLGVRYDERWQLPVAENPFLVDGMLF